MAFTLLVNNIQYAADVEPDRDVAAPGVAIKRTPAFRRGRPRIRSGAAPVAKASARAPA